MRRFLALLALQVRARRLKVYSYCLLTTHFHLVVSSPCGELSEAMRLVTNRYVRIFNRMRDRDGALFKGRFFSQPVESTAYLINLLAYVDANAVAAGIVKRPEDYPYCSAHVLAERCPPWLDPELDRELGSRVRQTCTKNATWAVERVISKRRIDTNWEHLVEGTPDAVHEWMISRCRLADGTTPGYVLVAPEFVHRRCRELTSHMAPPATTPAERHRWEGAIEAGMLRVCSGLKLAEICEVMGSSVPTVRKRLSAFCRVLESDDTICERLKSIVIEAATRGVRSERERIS